MKKFLYFFIAFMFLQGCANIPNSTAHTDNRKDAAILVGQGGGVSGFLKGAFQPLGTVKDTELTLINGERALEKEGSSGREYWLKPGTYRLWINCSLKIDNFLYGGGEEIEETLEAGKVYLIDIRRGTRPDNLLGFPETVCIPLLKEIENT